MHRTAFSRRRKLSVECIACSPSQIATELVSLMHVRAKEKDLSLKLAFDGPVPKTIQTDPTRLRQVLMNLVANAVKFTKRGVVRGNVSITSAYLHVAVDDDATLGHLFSVCSGTWARLTR